jgi:hypothetical protein
LILPLFRSLGLTFEPMRHRLDDGVEVRHYGLRGMFSLDIVRRPTGSFKIFYRLCVCLSGSSH